MTKSTFLALVLSLVVPCVTLAQEKAAPPASGDEPVVQAVTLTHAAVRDVAEAISELDLPVRVSPTTDNRLIIRGRPADVSAVMEQLVAKLDTPASAIGRASVDYIPLSHAPTGTLMPLLSAVAPESYDTRYAVDQVNRLLVVNARPETVAAIRKLVQTVDRPAESLHMHFVFLRAKIGTAAAEPAGIPKDLLPAVKALQQSGFSDVTLIAPLGVHANDGAHFESMGTLQGQGERPGHLRFAVEGTPHLSAAGETVQLELFASANGHYADPAAERQPTQFELKSTISAKLDSYVVLAAAPSSTADGDALILAVRVSRGLAGGH